FPYTTLFRSAGPQQVAGRAPGRADHRPAAREYPDGGAEHREAVDEVAGAVDRVDGPDHVMIAARAVEDLFAQDVVGRELDGQSGADQGLDALVDLGDRVAKRAFRPLVAYRQRAAHGRDDLGAGQRREFHREQLDPLALVGRHPAWRSPPPSMAAAAGNRVDRGADAAGVSPSVAAGPGTST